MKELAGFLIAVILSLSLGGIAGYGLAMRRLTLRGEVDYMRGEPFTAAVAVPEPVKAEVPETPLLPVRTDTVYIDRVMHVTGRVDTAAIIADYELKRSYVVPLFDGSYGKLDVSLSTQYNRLDAISYEFVPVSKTVYAEKTWQPFALVQYTTFGGIAAGGGTFYRKTGCYLMYSSDFRHSGFGAGVMFRF